MHQPGGVDGVATAPQLQVRGSIAMIKAWLDTDLADPPEVVIDTYLTLAPPWQLARPDETGHIAMRRVRSAGHVR